MSSLLAKEDFLLSLKLSPRLTVELLIENTQGELLLLRRDRPPFEGLWHVPGGFLLKDELIVDCAKRLQVTELGEELGQEGVFVGKIFETIGADVREGVSSHVLHYPIKYRLIEARSFSPPNGSWFNKLPKDIIPYHRRFLQELGYN
jgi:hypothetical protein